ncbi:hypothetical protein CERSUDRAFT_119075 [Gelatoporia subvermispora B]|uniref:Uncharacterized protein n=1 Tax=Ceriporiopsis subvermispora (strain B) TaxID=914234 RepID=M2QZS2_CERS8|nr:hypothetical protein CERSUDRAFT_119075 [Gelatoporia subvermispora B]
MEIDRVQFLTWLAASPEIEDITLSHVSFSSESDAPDPEMQPLHCLRRLVIKDMKEEGIAWLFAISALTPETAVLLDDVPLMAESEAAAIPHYPVTESVTRLAVWHTYSSTFMMATGSSAGLRQKSRDVPETPSIDSSIRLRFPLINVTEFWCISMSVSRVEMDMRLLLSEMPALSTLAVDEIDLPRLIQALSPSAQNGEYAAQAICPNLCVLHIIIWRHRDAQNILGSLDAVLSARKRAGCPLQRLILHSNPKDLMFRDPRASFSGIQSEWKRHREWTSLNLEMPEVCAQPAHRHWSPWSIF